MKGGFTIVGGTSLFRLAGRPDALTLHGALARQHIWCRSFDGAGDLLRFGLPSGDAGLDRLAAALALGKNRRQSSKTIDFGARAEKLGTRMHTKTTSAGNEYLCAMEKNQNGKYNVRVRAYFGRGGWSLPVYFLASSFNAAMKKLEEALQLLQKNEERLRFWGVERSDDPNVAGDLLREFGLWLDRRREFPRKVAELGIQPERPVPASLLAPVRRILADSVSQARPVFAAAGD